MPRLLGPPVVEAGTWEEAAVAGLVNRVVVGDHGAAVHFGDVQLPFAVAPDRRRIHDAARGFHAGDQDFAVLRRSEVMGADDRRLTRSEARIIG